MNTVGVIFPYKRNGIWAFDDPVVGLLAEPFVLGIPEMIELLVKDIADAEAGFSLRFSDEPFPEYRAKLMWVRAEGEGHWYRECENGMEGWLCPALIRYFRHTPKELYCAAAPRPTQY